MLNESCSSGNCQNGICCLAGDTCCSSDANCTGNYACVSNSCSSTNCTSGYEPCGSSCYQSGAGLCCSDTWKSGGDCCSHSNCTGNFACVENICSTSQCPSGYTPCDGECYNASLGMCCDSTWTVGGDCCSDSNCTGHLACISHVCSSSECVDGYELCGPECSQSGTGTCCSDVWRAGGDCCSNSDCAGKFACVRYSCSSTQCVSGYTACGGVCREAATGVCCSELWTSGNCCSDSDCTGHFACLSNMCSSMICESGYELCGSNCHQTEAGICSNGNWYAGEMALVSVCVKEGAIDGYDDTELALALDPTCEPPDPECPAGCVLKSFYIDKYEAYKAGDGKAGSTSGETPWVIIELNGAKTACAAAGKRLCRDFEWMAACNLDGERYDLTEEEHDETYSCNTKDKCSGSNCLTGNNTECKSDAGVHDMIGNVWEWTDALVPDDSWAGGDGTVGSHLGEDESKYGEDWLYHSSLFTKTGNAFLRGGDWLGSTLGSPARGCFTLDLNYGPSEATSLFGFRCCANP